MVVEKVRDTRGAGLARPARVQRSIERAIDVCGCLRLTERGASSKKDHPVSWDDGFYTSAQHAMLNLQDHAGAVFPAAPAGCGVVRNG